MAQQILYWQLPPQLPAPSFLLQSPFFSTGETGGSQTKKPEKREKLTMVSQGSDSWTIRSYRCDLVLEQS